MRGRAIAIGLGAAGVCSLALTAVALSERHPDASLAHGRTAILALEAAVGVALVAAAITIALTREAWVAAAFFAASALALEAQALPLPRAGGAALFTLALALGASAAPLAGGAVLAYTKRLSGGARLLLGAALGTCVV